MSLQKHITSQTSSLPTVNNWYATTNHQNNLQPVRNILHRNYFTV